MREKIFKVLSNSEQCLNAETLALALLKYAASKAGDEGIVFGVVELTKNSDFSLAVKDQTALFEKT
ncbi:MAG: hypothetical protein JW734_02835 [Candidatus Omnitrophica bacterium]|nr:hypothetical protein [Candidatus Omnitrophota bacterium]